MIDRLKLANFKAFASLDIRLGPYTLLSGLNSSGKSTVLQALALLRQTGQAGQLFGPNITYVEDPPEEVVVDDMAGELVLNGSLVELGIGRDVLHEAYLSEPGREPEIRFEIHAGTARNSYAAEYALEADRLKLTKVNIGLTGRPDFEDPIDDLMSLFSPGFQYLKADRINPATTFPRSFEMAVRSGFLGVHGEYTIDFLRHHGDEPVRHEALRHPGAASPRLLQQVEAWMGEICPGVRIHAEGIERTDLVRLGFQVASSGQLTSNPYRPTNVGFGLTYVLPVVVACLSAQPGAMLLLENPEAHIHPRGQSAMGRLTCAAASAGAQVIVETHSDHVLNGVRLTVKQSRLDGEQVVLHYFRRGAEGIEVVSPRVGPDGMLSQWPDGFFDEWDHTLDQLLD